MPCALGKVCNWDTVVDSVQSHKKGTKNTTRLSQTISAIFSEPAPPLIGQTGPSDINCHSFALSSDLLGSNVGMAESLQPQDCRTPRCPAPVDLTSLAKRSFTDPQIALSELHNVVVAIRYQATKTANHTNMIWKNPFARPMVSLPDADDVIGKPPWRNAGTRGCGRRTTRSNDDHNTSRWTSKSP